MNVRHLLCGLGTWSLLGAAPLCADETPAMEAFYNGVDALQQAAVKPTLPQQQSGWEKAEGYFRDAVKLKPDYAEAYSKLGQSLFNEGRCLEAVEAFRHSVTIDPRQTEAWYGMGYAYENLSSDKRLKDDEKTRKKLEKTQYKDAITAYKKAVDITPSNDINGRWRTATTAWASCCAMRP